MIVDHLALSLLWLVSCLGIITAPAGTLALSQVAAQRAAGADPGTGGAFLAAFRRHFVGSLALGIGWAALGCLLVLDVFIAVQIGPPTGDILLVALLALLLGYALITAALPAAAITFDTTPLRLVRLTTLTVLLAPGRAILGLGTLAAAIGVVWLIPLSLVIVPSVTAALLHRLYRGALNRFPAGTRRPETAPTRATALATPATAVRP
ncbi:DUF624 domain-containing protein [Natronosporangium hydrolyticum]|uniref:DUF624 domain-containing protein n=1 Tax=Natronosporangium hydrolyticum TaxID=2811111 RepID=A0A895YAW3_9ACTN|nr:DUF624 domain-containing protein [Natronosporangium hydrolyticum]QSB13382.1 DUF624 domain-containing protein [Natronosporangium hydrolyticum]